MSTDIKTNTNFEGHCEEYPLCTCGKCVVKRGKKDHFHSLPYSSRLNSIYQSDFNWKNPRLFSTDYLKATHSAQENAYKKNINNCMISTAKLSYKPFKVSVEGCEKKPVQVESVPFYGSTTYENTYINYGSTRLAKGVEVDNKDFRVAFRGKSNYAIDYKNYGEEDYNRSNKLIKYKPTLKFVGALTQETEFRDNYKQIDFNQPAYFGNEKYKKSDLQKDQMLACPFPKSNFESVSKTSLVNHFNIPCKLNEFMKKKNITSIEI